MRRRLLFDILQKAAKYLLHPLVQPFRNVFRTYELLAYLSTKEGITRSEVERIAGISMPSASRALRRLVQSGMLIRIGEGKNTRYQLAKK